MSTHAVVAGEVYLKGLTKDQIAKIKEDLTLPNPRYYAAVNFSRSPSYAIANIPKTITFYNNPAHEVFTVPRGYEFNADKISNQTVKVTVKWPKRNELFKPRKWQSVVLEKWRKGINDNDYFDYVATASPGQGKTVCGLMVAEELNQKTIVIVHTTAIMRSWLKDCKKMFGDKVVPGIIQGKKKKIGKHITIAMMQTLKKMSVEDWSKLFGLVIVDEAHHVPCSTIFELMRNSLAAYRFGITATASRSDKLDKLINWACGPTRSHSDKDEQFTVPLKIYRVATGIRLAKDSDDSPFDLKQPVLINRQSKSIPRLKALVALIKWIRSQSDNPILILTARVKLNKEYKRRLQIEGIRSSIYSSSLKESEREEFLTRAEQGKIKVTIASIQMLAEGVNIPCWTFGILCNSFSNPGLIRQGVGRIERKHESKEYGYWFDLVDDHPVTYRQYEPRSQVYNKLTNKIKRLKLVKGGSQWKVKRSVARTAAT